MSTISILLLIFYVKLSEWCFRFCFVFPRFTLFDDLCVDGLAIALFSYAFHVRLSNIFKRDRQHNQQNSGIKWNERKVSDY